MADDIKLKNLLETEDNDFQDTSNGSSLRLSRQLKSDAFQIYKRLGKKDTGSNTTTTKVTMEKTNAYGQMEFVGPDRRTRAQYIRLSDETPMKEVGELMKSVMSLNEWPKIMISVVGGLMTFDVNKAFKENLQKELLKICMKVAGMKKETWFVTSGADLGVTKLIAEAVEGYKYQDTSVIGITSWGVVANRDILIQDPKKVQLPKYPIGKQIHQNQIEQTVYGETFYLNKDHTHFFLVDIGKDGIFTHKEINFRSKFEKFIVEKQVELLQAKNHKAGFARKHNFTPAVQLVINGGVRTLRQIQSTLFPNGDEDAEPIMPVIVVEGSGRVANWINCACSLHDRKNQNEAKKNSGSQLTVNLQQMLQLQQEIKRYFPNEFQEIYDLTMKIVKERREYITIYRSGDSLDEKILWTFLKRRQLNSENRMKQRLTSEQLKMVMLWDRPDIAQNELKMFIAESKSNEMETIMTELLEKALIRQNIQFIDLIFELGFDMSKVNHDMIHKLYRKVLEKCERSRTNGLQSLISSDKCVRQNIYEMPRPCDSPTVVFSNLKRRNNVELMIEVSNTINKLSNLKLVDYRKKDIDDQFKDLFLWAVTSNKKETALVLWKRGENPIAKALVARRMFLTIAKKYKYSHDYDVRVYKSFLTNADHFGRLATELLERCSQIEDCRTRELINHDLSNWSDKNILELAALSEFQEFISHQRCKDIMDAKWHGDIQLSDGEFLNLKIFASICFIPLMFIVIRFKEEYNHKDGICCRYKDEKSLKWFQRIVSNRVACGIHGSWDKLRAFLSAPVTKFWTNSMAYVVFLCIFAFVMLNKLTDELDAAEYILLTFIVSFFFEEIKQVLREYGFTRKQKFRNWWRYHWNKVDFLALVTFTIGFILRCTITSSSIPYAGYFYAVDVFLWVLKLLQLFSLNRQIGVYVVMLQKMLVDVAYFVIVIMVLVVAYAIARFSVLYPDNVLNMKEKNMAYFSRKFLMVPFFQLFGKLFIEKSEDVTANSTVFGTDVVTPGRVSETFVVRLTFAYMVLANLLLVNLLIAVFNNTYNAVQSNAEKIWHWQNYQLVLEYRKRSFLPPPLSIISHINVLVQYLIELKNQRKANETNKLFDDKESSEIPLEDYFKKNTDIYKMLQFETECLANYLQITKTREQRMKFDFQGLQQPKTERTTNEKTFHQLQKNDYVD